MISRDIIKKHNEAMFMENQQYDLNELIDLGNGFYGKGLVTLKKIVPKDGKPFILLKGLCAYNIQNLLRNYNLYKFHQYETTMFVQKNGAILRQVTESEVKDIIQPEIEGITEMEVDINGVEAVFTAEAQKEKLYKGYNSVFNKNFYEFLPVLDAKLYQDDANTAYLHFENGTLKVTASSAILIPFNEAEGKCIWEDQVIPHPINDKTEWVTMFQTFNQNVTDQDEKRLLALESGIGYMLHNHHKKSGGQMLMLYDQEITDLDNPQGGTGKGLIVNGIMQLRRTVKIDGKKFTGKGTFEFQEITASTQILWLDDAAKTLDVDRFNSISTDGFNVERKNKDSLTIPREQAPKIVIASNVILDCTGSTRKRRQHPVELSNYYSSMISTGLEEPIVKEHGCEFYSEKWSKQEWNAFFWYMIGCIQLYLTDGLVAVPAINLIENRGKQILGSELFYWIKEQDFQPNKEYSTKDYFNQFKEAYEENNKDFKQRTFSNKLKKYFALFSQNIEFKSTNSNGDKIATFIIKD